MRGRPKAWLTYLVHSLNPGGTERLAMEMAAAFRSEFEVSIICLDAPGAWAADARRDGVPVYCLWRQPGVDLRLARPLARLASRRGTCLWHAHQYSPWFYAGLAKLVDCRAKLLFQEHGRQYPEVRKRTRIGFNRAVLLPRTDRVVAVSEETRQRLARFEGLPAARVEVVYNGVAAPPRLGTKERDAVRRVDLGFGKDEFVVGTVGRLDPIKNLPLLLEALVRARRREPRLRAILIGDGSARASLEEQVRRLGLQGVVTLTGYRPDAPHLVGALDLFVLSSFSEGTSLALLESMAAARPAVVTEAGGSPEIVRDGHTGWVVPPDDVEALAAALLAAAADPAETSRRGEAARRRFTERFSMERMIDRYRGIYEELLASG